MVHIILTGATGLVGGAVLRHILSLPPTTPITKLSILSRSPVPTATNPPPTATNTKTEIKVYTHKDYLAYPPDLISQLADASAVIWAQGVSQTEVSSTEEYVRITKEFPLAAAEALASARSDTASKPPLNFIYVSGEGATHTPGRLTQTFARVKGEAELALLSLPTQAAYAGKLAVFCPRPGGIWSKDAEVWRESLAKRNLTMRWVMRPLLPVFRGVYPGMLIEAEALAGVLVGMALRKGGEGFEGEGVRKGVGVQGRVLQNVALREMAGL